MAKEMLSYRPAAVQGGTVILPAIRTALFPAYALARTRAHAHVTATFATFREVSA